MGAILLLYAADLAMSSRTAPLSTGKVYYFIAMDAAWVLGSIVVVAVPDIGLTSGGRAIVVTLAIAVAAFGALQLAAIRARDKAGAATSLPAH